MHGAQPPTMRGRGSWGGAERGTATALAAATAVLAGCRSASRYLLLAVGVKTSLRPAHACHSACNAPEVWSALCI
jgi:ATP-dependent RNA circularization protein (DNA/RNA ligase family)